MRLCVVLSVQCHSPCDVDELGAEIAHALDTVIQVLQALRDVSGARVRASSRSPDRCRRQHDCPERSGPCATVTRWTTVVARNRREQSQMRWDRTHLRRPRREEFEAPKRPPLPLRLRELVCDLHLA